MSELNNAVQQALSLRPQDQPEQWQRQLEDKDGINSGHEAIRLAWTPTPKTIT